MRPELLPFLLVRTQYVRGTIVILRIRMAVRRRYWERHPEAAPRL